MAKQLDEEQEKALEYQRTEVRMMNLSEEEMKACDYAYMLVQHAVTALQHAQGAIDQKDRYMNHLCRPFMYNAPPDRKDRYDDDPTNNETERINISISMLETALKYMKYWVSGAGASEQASAREPVDPVQNR